MAYKDESFYFSMTIFLVEDTLFKVPRKPFEDQSDIFRSMFLLPPESEIHHDGMTDDKPVQLEGVSKADFRAFLKVLLPSSYGDDMDFTEQEWLSVLRLASMWDFIKIRQTAIEKLQTRPLDLITKIELAHKYEIREWLFGAYLALGKRIEPLSVEEGHRLGFDFAIKMASVREQLLRDKIAHPNAYRSQRPYLPASRTDSPRGPSRAGGSGSSVGSGGIGTGRMRSTAGMFWPNHVYPPELEDEDDIVLSKAIHEVFGIRGEPNYIYSSEAETVEVVGGLEPSPPVTWVSASYTDAY